MSPMLSVRHLITYATAWIAAGALVMLAVVLAVAVLPRLIHL